MREKAQCSDCGKPTSRRGRKCKDCMSTTGTLKSKACETCQTPYKPTTGASKHCLPCLKSCVTCKVSKSRHSPPNNCRSCSTKARAYSSLCKGCGFTFKDSNGRSSYCTSCESSDKCVDCSKQLSSKRKERCPSCSAKHRILTHGLPQGTRRFPCKLGIM